MAGRPGGQTDTVIIELTQSSRAELGLSLAIFTPGLQVPKLLHMLRRFFLVHEVKMSDKTHIKTYYGRVRIFSIELSFFSFKIGHIVELSLRLRFSLRLNSFELF